MRVIPSDISCPNCQVPLSWSINIVNQLYTVASGREHEPRDHKSTPKSSRRRSWTAGILVIAIVVLAGLAGLLIVNELKIEPFYQETLFSRVITWGDGSTETVEIDKDGFFILNGQKKRLLGFCDSMMCSSGSCYDTQNTAILVKELDYLQSRGVRLYLASIWPWAESEYDALLKLFYDHKMLLIPLFSLSGEPNFGDLSVTDFEVGDGTASTFFAAWLKHVKAFPNVVSIAIENEIDISAGHKYTLTNAGRYMDMLYNHARATTRIPLITKFGYIEYSEFATSVQNSFLHYSAIPSFNLYYSTPDKFAAACDMIHDWYESRGRNSQMWLTEMNYGTDDLVLDATKLTSEMVDEVFAHNVSAAFLFGVQDKYYPGAMFFDSDGNPIDNLNLLLKNLPGWQAAIP